MPSNEDGAAMDSDTRPGGPSAMTPIQRPRVNPVTAADICDVSVRTIYRWIGENRIEYVRTPTGAYRIFTDSLLREPDSERVAISA
jgi:excisionase family DNA binding protein